MKNTQWISFSRFVVIIICLFSSIGLWAQKEKKSDYILVINTYEETTPLAMDVINNVSKTLSDNKLYIPFYTEHINLLLIDSSDRLKEYKDSVFTKYRVAPKVIVFIGNSSWIWFKDDVKSHWGEIPTLLCTTTDSVDLAELSLGTDSLLYDKQVLLKEYTDKDPITVIHSPVYINETIRLMCRLLPKMKEIAFISDERFLSRKMRQEFGEITSRLYPDLKVHYFIEGKCTTDELLSAIAASDPQEVGWLFFSWTQKEMQAGNRYLLNSAYRTIGSFSTTPLFSLENVGVDEGCIAGGFFYSMRDLRNKMSAALLTMLSSDAQSTVTHDIYIDKPSYVLNYEALQVGNIDKSLYPKEAIYINKPASFIFKYRYILILLAFLILCVLFLIFRIKMMKDNQYLKEAELRSLANFKGLFTNMPIVYYRVKLFENENGEIKDFVFTDVNPVFEQHFDSRERVIGRKGSEVLYNYSLCLEAYKQSIADGTANFKYKFAITGKCYDVMVVNTTEKNVVDVYCIDNTELLAAQTQLKAVNHKLALALDISNIVPWKWDLKR
ncbi:MAG: hypothetical protein RR220_08595, partial [Bacteroidaceae bacterium]